MQNPNSDINEMMLADIMERVVRNATSSHDIIPRNLMPTISHFEIPRREEQFGDAAMKLYLSHLEFSRRLEAILMHIINQSEAFSRLSLLMMTMYKMGVGESHALVTMMYSELLKLRFTNFSTVMLYNAKIGKGHAIILVGRNSIKVGDAFPSKFESLNDDVLLIDPLLSYIGPANQYSSKRSNYLLTFNYNQIMTVQEATIDHLDFITSAERRADALVTELKTRYGLEPFIAKSLLPLAKTGYDCKNVTTVQDAPVLTELRKSGLKFFAIQRPNQEMDAVCSADSRIEALQANGLKDKLKTSILLTNYEGQTFFVIPQIQKPEEVERITQTMNPTV